MHQQPERPHEAQSISSRVLLALESGKDSLPEEVPQEKSTQLTHSHQRPCSKKSDRQRSLVISIFLLLLPKIFSRPRFLASLPLWVGPLVAVLARQEVLPAHSDRHLLRRSLGNHPPLNFGAIPGLRLGCLPLKLLSH